MKKSIFAITLIACATVGNSAYALDQIVRPYESIRSSAMGGVRLTTGLYDENFFGNPARVTANPKFRLTTLDPMIEANSHAIDRAGDFTGGGDLLKKFGDTAGQNLHVRVQTTFPSVYFPPASDGRMAYAFGLITSIQNDLDLRRNFSIAPQAIGDVGPAFTVGRKFLSNEALSIGMTAHLIYRANLPTSYSMANLLQNSTLTLSSLGHDGSMLDFDLGGTYLLPTTWNDFEFVSALAINNILGGKYSNIGFHPANTGNTPLQQNRAFGFGMSARRAALGPFTSFLLALEFTDIGNNSDGSLFRTVHLGTEAKYGILIPRLGINQGYFAGGLGFDLRFFTLEYAYYGEELTLNPGGMEDKRHAVRIAFQI